MYTWPLLWKSGRQGISHICIISSSDSTFWHLWKFKSAKRLVQMVVFADSQLISNYIICISWCWVIFKYLKRNIHYDKKYCFVMCKNLEFSIQVGSYFEVACLTWCQWVSSCKSKYVKKMYLILFQCQDRWHYFKGICPSWGFHRNQ